MRNLDPTSTIRMRVLRTDRRVGPKMRGCERTAEGCATGMWADNETTLTCWGFGVHADLIRSVVTEPGLLPITIGVFGDWGGGKTSVMKMLEKDLDPDSYGKGQPEKEQYKGVICLYFNGWLTLRASSVTELLRDVKAFSLKNRIYKKEKKQTLGPLHDNR